METALPASAISDFWRTPAVTGGALPDGVTDPAEPIARDGNVGLGSQPVFGSGPVAKLDVAAFANRTGADGRVPGVTPLYVTGNVPALAGGVVPPATPAGAPEFRHANQTQGIGVAYNGLFATGSSADQAFGLMQRGAGQFFTYWQALLGGLNYWNWVGAAVAANQGWYQRWFAGGVMEAGWLLRRSAIAAPGGTNALECFWQLRRADGALVNAVSVRPSVTNANTFSLTVEDNVVNDAKLVLWGTASTGFFGLGIKGGTLAYFVNAPASHHRWYAGPAPGTQILGLSGVGNLTIDPGGAAPGGWASPVLRFGGEGSGEGIRSQRVGGGEFVNGLEIYTAAARRIAIKANGIVKVTNLPTFANDGAAGAGGLTAGDLYRTAAGDVKVKL